MYMSRKNAICSVITESLRHENLVGEIGSQAEYE